MAKYHQCPSCGNIEDGTRILICVKCKQVHCDTCSEGTFTSRCPNCGGEQRTLGTIEADDTSPVSVLNLNNQGHESLAKRRTKSRAVKKRRPTTQALQPALSIFISHSAKDEKLAAALVALLRSALNIPR